MLAGTKNVDSNGKPPKLSVQAPVRDAGKWDAAGSRVEAETFPVRLAGGWDGCAGRVEVYYDNAWGTVCDDSWDIPDAQIVCKQLSCGSAVVALHNAYFGPGTGSIVLDNVTCTGNEQFLWQCSHRQWGSHGCRAHEVAGVICSETSTVAVSEHYDMQLVGGTDRCSGRVEIRYNNSWGTVCDDIWTINNAHVVCRQMNCGYATSALTDAYFGAGSGNILLDDVSCDGNESFLWDCRHIGWGNHNCVPHEDAGVICSESIASHTTAAVTESITSRTTAAVTEHYHMQLVGGPDRCSGRVEIRYNHFWGTVCDDIWTISNAHVVCRQMNCGYATSALTDAYFGEGSGNILLDDVNCNGNETFLWDCSHNGWLSHNCGHHEDAGVICSNSIASHRTTEPSHTTTRSEAHSSPAPNYTNCGGLLTQMYGNISSPFYPNDYPANANCTWQIVVPEGYYIQLSFLHFDLEINPSCQFDVVTIYDGIPGYSSQLAAICFPGNYVFYSTSNIMGINFKTDYSVQHSGFYAVYSSYYVNQNVSLPPTAVPGANYTDCGGVLNQMYGNISSPLYPSYYPNNADCNWEIRVPVGYYVQLSFRHFDLENHPSCIYDSVTIYDGIPIHSPRISTICNPGNYTYYSTSNVMGINFRSDSIVQRSGFLAVFFSIYNGGYTTSSPAYTNCGGLLTQMHGNISSPFFPSRYPNNANCNWDIRVPAGYRVQLSFLHLDLETHPSCAYDSVSIYDGIPNYSPRIATICNPANYSYSYYSSSNIMGINFRSDSSVQQSGFLAVFSAVYGYTTEQPGNRTLSPGYTNCGGLLTQMYGNISSPFYPSYYPNNANCNWDIRVPAGYRVQLSFLHFDLETHPSCAYDSVTIYDGIPNYSPPIATICNPGNYSYTYYSSSNIMGINFRSDSSVQQSGFLAVFSAVYGYTTQPPVYPNRTDHWVTTAPNYTCGGVLTEPSGRFSSPLFPGFYPDNAYCVWEIRVLPGYTVDLSFTYMDLEYHSTCNFDSVSVYDGLPLSSPLLAKICSPVNSTIISSFNVMGVLFRTDGSVRRSGFQAVYTSTYRSTSQPVNCGGILNNHWGIIESPLYPNSHSPADCVWHIQSSNSIIHISFNNVSLGNSHFCSSESVSVYDGTVGESRLLGKFCGQQTINFISSSNSLSIVYSSRGSNSGSLHGFQANYFSSPQNNQSVILNCGSYSMEAQISRSYLQSLGYSTNDIFLNDAHCRPHSYGDWLSFSIPYDQCGTVRQGERDTVSYSNTVQGFHSGQIIERSKKLSLNLRCQMYQNTMVEIMYHADDVINQTVTQYGLYYSSLNFYYTPSFNSPIYQYPYYVALNQDLYLQATLHTSDSNLTLFVDTCVASPDPNDFVTLTYDLIRNGCIKDSTYVKYSANNTYQARFGFRAFGFVRKFSRVYVQCKLAVCPRNSYNSRCNQGCIRRRKRASAIPHESVSVTAGPIQWRDN
ncbi:deleted in malignant brain tumors 1 protein-like [Hyperolius riggenbachi]|uniref:deleted in malignant brain tumors 1 protein-like n=1 Tax=Hyperolius riggenbachi TaxID=752182 RepID=UPI0035A27136